MTEPYNPLDTLNLAKSIEGQILAQRLEPLGELRKAKGAGVYAIYYTGSFPAYSLLSASIKTKREVPIYVGKAIPKGGRIGGLTRDAAKDRRLGERLAIHADSIRETTNIDVNDFYARYLVVEDVWIPLGENMLIQRFKPVWNVVAAGFGNKAPGKGRPDQAMSRWDTLHPGRAHSRLLGPNKLSAEEIEIQVVKFLQGKPVPLDIEDGDQEEEMS